MGIKTIVKTAGITMGVMFIMDKAQNMNPMINQFTGPRQTVVQKFMDIIMFWK
jgi:hypothetical protein